MLPDSTYNILAFILTEVVLVLVGLTSSFVMWFPLRSPELIEFFTIPTKLRAGETNEQYLKRRAWNGFLSETTRAISLGLLVSFAFLFYAETVNFLALASNPIVQGIAFLIVALAIVWCVYPGPNRFAAKYKERFKLRSRSHFNRFTKPYLAWMGYAIAIWGWMGLLALTILSISIIIDYDQLNRYAIRFSNLHLLSISDLQHVVIDLSQYGTDIALISQKYIVTCLLVFIYVFIESRWSINKTMLDSSPERLRIGAWIILLLTLGISLFVLPNNYAYVYQAISKQAQTLTISITDIDQLSVIISVRQYFEAHDLQWLILKILSGYGNLASLLLLGLVLLLWRGFLKNIPSETLMDIFVPKFILQRLRKLSQDYTINIDLKFNDDSK